MSRSTFTYFVVFPLLSLVMLSCGRKAIPGEESVLGVGPGWEIAWVDPQIVSSDQFHTLIYAVRIDSMRVGGVEPMVAPGTTFRVEADTCLVTIDLLDLSDRIVTPLVVRRLPAGWYKLTLTPAPPKSSAIAPGPYIVEIDHCGQVNRTPVVLQ